MILREFLDNINKMVEKDSSVLDLKVIYSKDDEGNGYQEVYYDPTLFYSEDDFTVSQEDFDDEQECFDEELVVNAICIN